MTHRTCKALIIGVFCLLTKHSVGQNVAACIGGNVSYEVYPRWHVLAMAQEAIVQKGSLTSNVVRVAGGAAFNIYENIHGAFGVSYGISDYFDNDSRDKTFTLIETIVVLNEKNRHDFVLMQRTTKYEPYNLKSKNSILGYGYTHNISLNEKWRLAAGGMLVINTHQDVEDATILQRVKARVGVSRSLRNHGRASVSYTGMLGGKGQNYILDRHGLNLLTLTYAWGN